MDISTLIATHNSERYVSQALDSVLFQTRRSDEIVVVDDGSTDRTPEVLKSYASKICVITQNNSGPSRAFNVAMAAANGDVFAFLDCDDLWMPEKLKVQEAALAADKDLEAVFGSVQQFVSSDVGTGAGRNYMVSDCPQPGISKITMLIHRAAFERIGRFEEGYVANDFFDWYARANVLGLRWRMLPEVVALRRHHPGNAGRRLRAQQRLEMLNSLKHSLDLRRRKVGPRNA